MRRTPFYIVVVTIVLMIGSTSLVAQTLIGPQSVGLAQTYTTQSRGVNVMGWNPANLGYVNNPRFSFRFGILPLIPFPSIQMVNSSVSLGWFNRYFTNGGILTNEDKRAILGVFPKTGWDFSPQFNVQLLGMSFRHRVVTLEANAQGNVVLPTSLLSLGLYGNEFSAPISLNDLNTEAQVVAALSYGQGRQIYIPYLSDVAEETYIGGGVKALIGLGYAGTESATGSITTYPERVVADGNAKARYALGGYGFALDAGLSAKFNDRIQAGLALNNLLGTIQWSKRNSMVYKYRISLDTDTLDLFSDESDSLLDKAVKIDTSYKGETFRTPYPAYLVAGVQYELSPSVQFYFNYKQGFSHRFNMTTTPRISLATELNPVSWFTFRTGLAVGGKERLQLAAGFGFHSRHYAFDIGAASSGGLFNHSRGVSLSMGQELRW